MDKQEFIKAIAGYVQKYAHSYGILVHSPIIAQAILESGAGTSELAVNACNYFGLKYRKDRCKTCIGIYEKVGSEQNQSGSYTNSLMQWCKFPDMETGVIGYFDFINIPNYQNLKGITDPRAYLETIKAAGYATSLKYVDNLMDVIARYDLTQYDRKGESDMSNSPLVSYTKISPNKTSPRNHAIDTVTIHCVVGQCSVERLGEIFAPTSRQASCNYGIGPDGRIGMYVEEKDRSWCSSNAANDNRAITIEVASDTTHPYAVTDAAYNALIELLADICKRNGIKSLKWQADKNLVGQVDKQNMTVHRWFANKSCPGDYLYNRHGAIASAVNAKLGAAGESTESNAGKTLYRVQTGAYLLKANAEKQLQAVKAAGFDTYMVKSGLYYKIQVGAYSVKANAENMLARIKAAGFNGFITTKSGNAITSTAPAKKSVDEVAKEVIAGKWGNGDARKEALVAAGYDYSAVQAAVNKLLNK